MKVTPPIKVMYERCAGLDVHKKTVVVCVLITLANGMVEKFLRTFSTMTADLLALDEWLHSLGVEHIALESTGVYWHPIYNLLEDGRDIILVNPTDDRLSGVMQFLPAQQISLRSDSPYSIPRRSSIKLGISGQTSEIVGMVKVVPDQDNVTPSVAAIYTFTSGGILVSASGAAANDESNDFDIYSEISGQPGTIGSIQTGVAIANAFDKDVDVRFEFVSLDGKSTGIAGVLELPAHGQIHSSIPELPGAENLPRPFQGTLHISSATPIAALAIRARYNERGDFLLSTTPPSPSDPEDNPQDEAFIPQILDGGGYSTQIVIFGGTDEEQPASGNIYFFDADGQPIDPPVE